MVTQRPAITRHLACFNQGIPSVPSPSVLPCSGDPSLGCIVIVGPEFGHWKTVVPAPVALRELLTKQNHRGY